MVLTVQLGATVTAVLDGHSAVNGATIPDTAKVAATSNDPTVATVDAAIPVPAGGAQEIMFPVTVLAVGSTDLSVTVTLADGTVFTDTASLIVGAVVPGLTHVSLTLTSP